MESLPAATTPPPPPEVGRVELGRFHIPENGKSSCYEFFRMVVRIYPDTLLLL